MSEARERRRLGPESPGWRSPWRWLWDLAACLRFGSRLPVPALRFEGGDQADERGRTLRLFPLAGALLAAIGALAFLAGEGLGLGAFVSAALAIAALTLVTGALHEDGLADTVDGFGGGTTPARRLEIMRDSRIGTFGAGALVLSFTLRIGALATLADRLPPAAVAAAIVIAATLSRAACLAPLALLPPARESGLGRAYASARVGDLAAPWAWAVAIAFGLGRLVAIPITASGLAVVLAAGAGLGLTALARRLIGGQTGDVAGAAQQAAEIAALLGLLIALPR